MEVEYIVEDGSIYCVMDGMEVEVKCTVEKFLEIIERQGY